MNKKEMDKKEKIKRSAIYGAVILVWVVLFIIFGAQFESLLSKVGGRINLLLTAVALGVPAFFAYLAMTPWLDDIGKEE